jgi:hypothetical protein
MSTTSPHGATVRAERCATCWRIAAVIVLTGTLATVANAQGPTIAPPVLGIAGSTRGLALGNAYTALGSDPDVIFYNPALLVPARGIGVALQHYERESSVITLSAASVLAPGTVGIGIQVLDQATSEGSYREMSRPGERALFVRGPTLATGAVASLAYARPAFFNTRVGITGKVIHQQFGDSRDITGAFDVGLSRGGSVQLALVGRNLGHGIRLGGSTVALPREIAFGAGIPRREVGPLDLAAGATVSMLADGSLTAGGGTEWGWMPLDGFTFAARVGYRVVEAAESHVTLGGGFIGERVSLDYAFQASDGPGDAHRFGVRWR